MHDGMVTANTVLVGKSEGNKALLRTRSRWENKVNVYFKENLPDNVGWTSLFQDRVLWWAVMITVTHPWFL